MRNASPLHTAPLDRRQFCVLTALGLLSGAACASTKELRVLTAPTPNAQRAILQSLRVRFPSLVSESNLGNFDARLSNTPLITLGPVALKTALDSEVRGPVISAFTSSQTYRRLVSASTRERGVTGLYADASPLAQFQLISTLFERKVTVGVLISEASSHLERALKQAAQQTGLDLLVHHTELSQDPARALNNLSGAQVLLALPDSTLYTPDALRAVLESTYRRGMPVIGFSQATVAAGTLASAYPDIDDIVADLGELLDNINMQANDALPEARFARYWRVIVNDNVARSMGIAITDKVRALGVRPPGRSG